MAEPPHVQQGRLSASCESAAVAFRSKLVVFGGSFLARVEIRCRRAAGGRARADSWQVGAELARGRAAGGQEALGPSTSQDALSLGVLVDEVEHPPGRNRREEGRRGGIGVGGERGTAREGSCAGQALYKSHCHKHRVDIVGMRRLAKQEL